jgi:AbiV family abortive infection protein
MANAQKTRDEFLALYRLAHNNASDLLRDAEILLEKERYPRAYALAFTALEEIAKSQLAADVFTGLIEEEEFLKYYLKHEKKIGRMAWATEDAKRYLDLLDGGEDLEIEKPTFGRRNDGMYVSLTNGKVVSPSDVISRDDARGIIHTVEVALRRIHEVTEFWGHQIGTKGFMK